MTGPNPDVPLLKVLEWYQRTLMEATHRVAVLQIALEQERERNDKLAERQTP